MRKKGREKGRSELWPNNLFQEEFWELYAYKSRKMSLFASQFYWLHTIANTSLYVAVALTEDIVFFFFWKKGGVWNYLECLKAFLSFESHITILKTCSDFS